MSLIDVKKKLLMAQQGGADVSELFNTSLWTGTGAARTITTGIDSGEGSLVWIKSRSAAYDNVLFDTLRGAGGFLSSNQTSGQTVNLNYLSSFSSSGYGLGTNATVNGSPNNYVGWQFRRAEKFFDIVQYTGNGTSGTTISHSLGSVPGMIIIKRTNSALDWVVYHSSAPLGNLGVFNTTAAFATNGALGGSGSPPTDVDFTLSGATAVNQTDGNYIAYIFANEAAGNGLISCGSYVGNASVSGPSVVIGWRPQYILIKRLDGTSNWMVFDASRSFANPEEYISANLNNAATSVAFQVIQTNSDGFSLVTSNSAFNISGGNYMYMAIREAS